MIGVAAAPGDLPVAEEFFELFKTHWRPVAPRQKYDVVLSVGEPIDTVNADSFILYGRHANPVDRKGSMTVDEGESSTPVRWGDTTFPVYCGVALFSDGNGLLECGAKSAAYRTHDQGRPVQRIGYDLFQEVRYLLTEGQPTRWAATPTLDWHIALLRRLIQDLRVSFLEIAPRPSEHRFICCLTHDVDFYGIRRHFVDRTLAGFSLRASAGTLVDLLRCHRTLSEALKNWLALLALPFVFLRLLPDFWRPFEDYAKADGGRPSTFFLIPFKRRSGAAPDGSVRAARAVPYQISEIRQDASAAAARGSELAVHGIDAWRDVDAGRAELAELTAVTGRSGAGIRMHWLYFANDSATRLEDAGYEYDSTWGFNDTVGYRAGTSQVFRPLASKRLLELPLSIMDSALFYPGRLGLTPVQGSQLCRPIVAHARRAGGTLVINWHDRSLAPERLWGRCYEELQQEVASGDGAWFATAADAVHWFSWRRSIRFIDDTLGGVRISASKSRGNLPPAQLTVHRYSAGHEPCVEELPFRDETALGLPL